MGDGRVAEWGPESGDKPNSRSRSESTVGGERSVSEQSDRRRARCRRNGLKMAVLDEDVEGRLMGLEAAEELEDGDAIPVKERNRLTHLGRAEFEAQESGRPRALEGVERGGKEDKWLEETDDAWARPPSANRLDRLEVPVGLCAFNEPV